MSNPPARHRPLRAPWELAALPNDAWASFIVRDRHRVEVGDDARLQAGDEVLVLADSARHADLISGFPAPVDANQASDDGG